ncbi:MAG: hypothetical protein HYZ20_13260 [Burkholderiales bacterium]|nr:hypothetical protein [Burkholderiales bacterium]
MKPAITAMAALVLLGCAATPTYQQRELRAPPPVQVRTLPPAVDERQRACEVDTDDIGLIGARDGENAAAWSQALEIPSWKREGSVLMAVTTGVSFVPACDGSAPCEIPVVVRSTAMGCQALLPYRRYCVKQGASGQRPSTIRFRLAREVDPVTGASPAAATDGVPPRGYQWLTESDGYEFVDIEPQIRTYTASVRGLHIHERGASGMGRDYFRNGQRSADGLSFTWEVGPVNTLGDIPGGGRPSIRSGLLSAAFVRPRGSTGVGSVCLPQDPIIVNVAN